MKNSTPQSSRVLQSSIRRVAKSFLLRARTLSKVLIYLGLTTFVLTAVPAIQAQSCEDIPSGGAQSMSAQITIDGTGEVLTDQAVVPRGTHRRVSNGIWLLYRHGLVLSRW